MLEATGLIRKDGKVFGVGLRHKLSSIIVSVKLIERADYYDRMNHRAAVNTLNKKKISFDYTKTVINGQITV